MSIVNVYVVNHCFTTEELNKIGNTLNDERGYGTIANFRIQVSSHMYYLNKEPTPSIVVLGKLPRQHIKKVMGPESTTTEEAKKLHNLSFTFLYLKPPVIVFNAENWNTKPSKFDGTQDEYLTYLINHEFGHAMSLLHESSSETLCPVMYQQSLGTEHCTTKNYWPSADNLTQAKEYLDNW